MPQIYNIPANKPFADSLVRGILDKYGNNPLTLPGITLLLPNRRSCKTVQEAFLRATNGKPTLLPKMQPLGDVGDEDFSFKISLGNITPNLPQVISGTRQRLLLARLIEKFQGGYIGTSKITTAQSTSLAVDLAAFLDEVRRHQLSFDKLRAIVPEELAKHWQITLDFMDIIITSWPAILAERGVTDVATHRNMALDALSKYWQDNPPAYPVIAAGSTGSVPATSNLLKVIANLPNGAVILPGMDVGIVDTSWDKISETHPQYGLKGLLENLNIPRKDVIDWESNPHKNNDCRTRLISEMMRPAETSYKWQNLPNIPVEALLGINYIEAATLQDEARIIAVIFRDTLETKGRTAALVTNNYSLAERVKGIMSKWGVIVDNSAGTNLAEVPSCVFLRLIARMAENKVDFVDMLACFKHPMASAGYAPGPFKTMIREIERKVLRKQRISGGFDGITEALYERGDAKIAIFLKDITRILQPFLAIMQQQSAGLQDILHEHIKIAEALATTDLTPGSEIIWGRDDGASLREFFDELLDAAPELSLISPMQYTGILEALLAGRVYRPKYGSHPRISILSPMEARMQGFDLVILGGLNEGSWPQMMEAGPWMSRPMRKNFGLPLPEQKIGQSAHDFSQLMHNKNIVLSRSLKIDGTATVASRWLMRLNAVMGICKKEFSKEQTDKWQEWTRMLDTPDYPILPCLPPQPAPPFVARPMEVSVSQVEVLMTNPYAHYANKILRLKKLDPIDMEPDAREFGIIIHKVIENFVTAYNNIPENMRLNFMKETWHNILKTEHIPASIQEFWQPKFESIAEEFVEKEQIRRKNLKAVRGEVKGTYTLFLDNGQEFKVTARADRIEIDNDNEITIIDYKAKSAIPGINKSILNGTLPQLPLEALIANNNGFENISGSTKELEYWLLKGSNDKDAAIKDELVAEKLDKQGGIANIVEVTQTGINLLVNTFTTAKTPYLSCPDPEKTPNFNNYEHLSRKKEY